MAGQTIARRSAMLRAVALWLLGVPLFVIILLYLFNIM
jgi:uncharacterized RDD family membrane protein YckC